MRHLLEWFKEAAGLWMLIGILSVALLVYSAARQFGFRANLKIEEANSELQDISYEKYDGVNLTGAEVISALKRYQNELPVTIYTGESVDKYNGNFKQANNNPKSEKYINPYHAYVGTLLKDGDKETKGLVFAKEGVLLTETSYKELLADAVGADAMNSTMDDLIGKVSTSITALQQNITSLNTSLSNLQTQNSSLTAQLNTLTKEETNGKSSIAAAITKKGVPTSASASYAVMSANISNIPGTKFKSGTGKIASGTKEGIPASLTINTGFAPKVVIIEEIKSTGGQGNPDYIYSLLKRYYDSYNNEYRTTYRQGGYCGDSYGNDLVLSSNGFTLNGDGLGDVYFGDYTTYEFKYYAYE